MSHISELYKKIEELQKQLDEMKVQNEKFQDSQDEEGRLLIILRIIISTPSLLVLINLQKISITSPGLP